MRYWDINALCTAVSYVNHWNPLKLIPQWQHKTLMDKARQETLKKRNEPDSRNKCVHRPCVFVNARCIYT